jgi:chromosome segregation ATPase
LSQVSETLRDGCAHPRDAGQSFPDFVSSELERLDDLRLEIEERERALAMREAELLHNEESLDLQRQRLEHLRMAAEHSARQVQQEARRLRESDDAASGDSARSLEHQPLQPGELSWARQRRRLVAQLDTARQRVAQMSTLAIDLAKSNRELAEAQKKIAKLQHRLAQQKGHFEPSMRQRLDLLEAERENLLVELRRAQAEIDRLRNERDNDWLAELARVRSLFERKLTIITAGGDGASTDSSGVDSLDGLIEQLIDLQAELDCTAMPSKERCDRPQRQLNGRCPSSDEND